MSEAFFTSATVTFLRELAQNNDRDWFAANKQRYERDVLDPALAFIGALQGPLGEIAPAFQAVPKRVGGSLMRVYRDTRFSRNKAPYKTNVGIQCRHVGGKDVHAPGFYLHIEPDSVFVGCGAWHPAAVMLSAIRTAIVERTDEWHAIVHAPAFTATFELAGDSLKRAPRGFDNDHPAINDLRRKDFIAVADFAPADALGSDFLDLVVERFRCGQSFMRFLCEANDLSYE
ncbi:MAG: DUF2461 domain-containing protein [Pseudomonadota bacterium]